MLKGLALWALGLPLPIILVLYLFNILWQYARSVRRMWAACWSGGSIGCGR